MDDEARRKHREYMRAYRELNRERDREYQKAYHSAYYERDPQKARDRASAWYEANRERALEAARQRNAAKPKKGRSTGESHHRWKGDAVGYGALHRWIERHKGKPELCDHCGSTTAKRFEWANVDHQYRRVLEDWLRLCTSCHRQHDYANGLSATSKGSSASGADGRASWRDGFPSARKRE